MKMSNLYNIKNTESQALAVFDFLITFYHNFAPVITRKKRTDTEKREKNHQPIVSSITTTKTVPTIPTFRKEMKESIDHVLFCVIL